MNPGQVRTYFVGRLERQVALTGDPELIALLEDVADYPGPEQEPDRAYVAGSEKVAPFAVIANHDRASERNGLSHQSRCDVHSCSRITGH